MTTRPPDGPGQPPEDAPESAERREALAALAILAANFFAGTASAAVPLPKQPPLGQPAQPGPPVTRQPGPGQLAPAPVRSGSTTDFDLAARAVLAALPAAVGRWQQVATFRSIRVMAMAAIGGRLEAPPLGSLIQVPAQAPTVQALLAPFATSVGAAWDAWTRTATVPGLPWYPLFVAFPGPMGPPTPNIPTPLLTLAFDPRPMLPANLAAAVRGGLGGRAGEPGAANAIDLFAGELAAKFYLYLAQTQVTLVMGQGPVPGFAPPYVPAFPVIDGTAEGAGLTAGRFL